MTQMRYFVVRTECDACHSLFAADYCEACNAFAVTELTTPEQIEAVERMVEGE